MEGAHVFMYVCDLIDAGRRTVIGSAPLPFFGAIFDSSCIQRPMFAGVTALARKLESALDEATSACERADIHQFLLYFQIIRIFTGIFQYSNYRSIDWHAMLLTPFLTSALWRHDDFVQAPVINPTENHLLLIKHGSFSATPIRLTCPDRWSPWAFFGCFRFPQKAKSL